MTHKTICIAIDENNSWEAASKLWSILAFPTNEKEQERFALAYSFLKLRATATNAPKDSEPWLVRPIYLLQDFKKSQQTFKHGCQIINLERLPSAEIAEAYLLQFASGKKVTLKQNGTDLNEPLTLSNISAHKLRQQDKLEGTDKEPDGYNTKNFEFRNWRHSKPVLHLAFAALRVMRELYPNEVCDVSWLDSPSTLVKICSLAEELREVLPEAMKYNKLVVSKEDLIEVRMVAPQGSTLKNISKNETDQQFH